MRTLRRLLYFVFGLLLGAVVTLAHAETMAPIPGWRLTGASVYYGEDLATLCQAAVAEVRALSLPQYRYHSVSTTVPYACNVSYYPSTSKYGSYGTIVPMNVCPYGQGWTLSGGVCTKPDSCPAAGTGTGSNETGVKPTFENLYGWQDQSVTAVARIPPGSFCMGGCTVSYAAGVCVPSTQAGTNNCSVVKTTYMGSACTGTAAPVASSVTGKPPCAQGEGVVTMGGKVACVPNGASPDIPKVSKNSSTQTFPDGSTKVTNTTTTCSGAGACSTTTTITNTVATSGPNAGGAGQAGDPGTTTSDDEESGDDEFCAKNPTLQMCKGGMSEEGTQKSVLAEIKKLTTAPTDTNFADGDDFDQPLEGVDGDAAQKLIDSYKSTTDALKVGFDDQNAPKSEPKFLEILGNWFDDVPQTGCEPPEFAVAGHSLDLAGWCPTAEKISNIGAYALWFMTLVGLFVMVTGGKGNT